jgi:hypothetical protein
MLCAQAAVHARPTVDAQPAERLAGAGSAQGSGLGSRPDARSRSAPAVVPEPSNPPTRRIPAALAPRAEPADWDPSAAPTAPGLWRAPVPAPPAARPTRRRAVAWGAAAGALAGTLSGLAVLAACDDYCAGVRVQGMARHIAVGTVAGGAIGALVHQIRR